jgi:integrase
MAVSLRDSIARWRTEGKSIDLLTDGDAAFGYDMVGEGSGLKSCFFDFRFHDLRDTWASWHRQAGTSTDELKDLGGWKPRVMVDCYAKFATENLAATASRIESVGAGANVIELTSRCGCRGGQSDWLKP